MGPVTDLRTAWHELMPGAADLGTELLRRWTEPQRHYHDAEHLAEVLDALDVLAGSPARELRLAAWFHDAVYDPVRDDNEERSAELARRTLAATGIAAADVAEVVRLVRLTATHDPDPGDSSGVLLCDADLAILGAPPDRYQRYAADVRREYAHVPEATFRAARGVILRGFLDRAEIYRTPTGRDRWESAARRNLATELGKHVSAGAGGDADRQP
jgi:predicted metal-dependent HD superfamily phosphohydrolase